MDDGDHFRYEGCARCGVNAQVCSCPNFPPLRIDWRAEVKAFNRQGMVS